MAIQGFSPVDLSFEEIISANLGENTQNLSGVEIEGQALTSKDQFVTKRQKERLIGSIYIQRRKIDLSAAPKDKKEARRITKNLQKSLNRILANQDLNGEIDSTTKFSSEGGLFIDFKTKSGKEYHVSEYGFLELIEKDINLSIEEKKTLNELTEKVEQLETKKDTKQLEELKKKRDYLFDKKKSSTYKSSDGFFVRRTRFNQYIFTNPKSKAKIKKYDFSSTGRILSTNLASETIFDTDEQVQKIKKYNQKINKVYEVQHYEKGKRKFTDFYHQGEAQYRLDHTKTYTIDGKKHRVRLLAFKLPKGEVLFANPLEKDFESSIKANYPKNTKKNAIDFLKSYLNTKEKFEQFEKIYWSHFNDSSFSTNNHRDKVLAAIREHGEGFYDIKNQKAKLESLYRDLGAEIELNYNSKSSIQSSKVGLCPLHKVARLLPRLKSILETYPPQFILRNNIDKIHLFDSYTDKKTGEEFRGFFSDGQVYVSAKIENTNSKLTLEKVTHHELAHEVDEEANGFTLDNTDWAEQYHGSNQIYSSELYNGKGIWKTKKNDTGFKRLYGRKNPNEDLATAAEGLFTSLSYRQVESRAQIDTIFGQKFKGIKRFYKLRSNGRMDEQFWLDIKNGETINPGYWSCREARGDFNNEECTKHEAYGAVELEFKQRQEEIKSLIDNKEYTKAGAILEKLITANPYLRQAFDQLAAASRNEPKLEPILIKAYRNRLKELPIEDHAPSYYCDLANLEFKHGETDQAQGNLEKAIRIFPKAISLKQSLLKIVDDNEEKAKAMLKETGALEDENNSD